MTGIKKNQKFFKKTLDFSKKYAVSITDEAGRSGKRWATAGKGIDSMEIKLPRRIVGVVLTRTNTRPYVLVRVGPDTEKGV